MRNCARPDSCAAVVALLLGGCGKKTAESTAPLIGLSLADLKEERWQKDRDLFIAKATELGAQVIVQDAGGDPNTQIQQCDNMLVRDSEHAQVQIIHQELSLVNDMTAAENICLGNETTRGGFIDFMAMRLRARTVLEKLSGTISPDAKIGDLTIGQQQIVEIAKALSRKARIIVFDEPTAALPEKDVEILLALICRLRDRGMGTIYISHKLSEVIELADVISVLRNGERVSQFVKGSVSIPDMVRDMVGRSLDTMYPALAQPKPETLVALRNVSLPHPDHPGKMIVRDLSLSCDKGEIVGIAGLLGAGRTALLSLIFGAFRGDYTGDIHYCGQPYRPVNPADAIGRGIALVSEDRKRYGLIGAADVHENLQISSLRQFCTYGILSDARSMAECRSYVGKLAIKTPSIDFPILNLSGGNQQKVIVGRFLMAAPRLLLLDDPTGGLIAYRGIAQYVARESIPLRTPWIKAIAQNTIPDWLAIALLVLVILVILISILKMRVDHRKAGLAVDPLWIDITKFVFTAATMALLVGPLISGNGVPIEFVLFLALAFIVSLIARLTRFGHYVYAIGGNKQAAFYSGISIAQNTVLVFGLMGLLSAVAGIVTIAELNAAAPDIGELKELEAIGACVIGGTSLMGGSGVIGMSVMGALIMASIKNGMSMVGIVAQTQKVILGALLVVAVALDQWSRRRK